MECSRCGHPQMRIVVDEEDVTAVCERCGYVVS